MFHAEPEFRGLILRVAEGHVEDLAVLADWLEERGDWRVDALRHGPLWVCDNQHASLLPVTGETRRRETDREHARRVLALFPEGPRWRLRQPHWAASSYGNEEEWLTPADAEDARDVWKEWYFSVGLGRAGVVLGPEWPPAPLLILPLLGNG